MSIEDDPPWHITPEAEARMEALDVNAVVAVWREALT
jgi:hypothetical protein